MSLAQVLAAPLKPLMCVRREPFDLARCSKSLGEAAALLHQSIHAAYRMIVWPKHADADNLDPGLRADDYGRDRTFSNHSEPNGVLSGLRGGRWLEGESLVIARSCDISRTSVWRLHTVYAGACGPPKP